MSEVKTLNAATAITEKELTSLQEVVNKQNQIKMQIGGLEGHKALLIEALKEATGNLSVIQKELEAEYGAINVDLTSGEISKDAGAEDN